MPRVEIVNWNPSRPALPRPFHRLPFRRPLKNFGDLLGPIIVNRLLRDRKIDTGSSSSPTRRLIAVGSVLRLCQPGDTIWGTGANGKSLKEPHDYSGLDVRAVRGPKTRSFLREQGVDVPEVYGDPGILIGSLWSRDELARGHAHRPTTVVPNFHDLNRPSHKSAHRVTEPTSPLFDVLGAIAASDLVVGSSLHAIVVAESLGIPARFVASDTEPSFKYEDYYLGTGRTGLVIAPSAEAAVEMGGQPAPSYDPRPLIEAFPADLWLEPTTEQA